MVLCIYICCKIESMDPGYDCYMDGIIKYIHAMMIVQQLIILRSQKYFMDLTLLRANFNTVSDPTDLIESSGRATILLSNNTKIYGFDFAESKY